MQDRLITINLSLPNKQLTFKVPNTMTLNDLKIQIIPYLIPEDKDSTDEFNGKSLKNLVARKIIELGNLFLHHQKTASSSLETTTRSTATNPIRRIQESNPKGGKEDIEKLNMCELDPEALIVREKPLSVSTKKEIKRRISRSRKLSDLGNLEAFVYKGQILDEKKSLADYDVTDYSTIYYGTPTKVSFKNITQNKRESFYATSETLAGELKEMISKMGLIQPQEDLTFNNKGLSDHELPELSTANSTDSENEIHIEPKKRVVRLLSLDGGGIRGVAVATILEEIEAATKKRIHELFDVVVGTSTGGLLAILMSIPTKEGKILTAAEARQLYIDKRYEMFTKNPWFKNNLAYPKYTADGFENVVKSLYGNMTLRNAIIPMGVVATDYNLHKAILLNSMRAQLHEGDYRHNLPVWKAARATTAAPTFYPPIAIGTDVVDKSKRSVSPTRIRDPPSYTRGSIVLEDGGTTTNNPTLLGIRYAQRALAATCCQTQYDMQVFSIGTGHPLGYECPPPTIDADGSLLNFVSKFAADPLFISRSSYNTHVQVINDYFDREEGPGSNYFRVQFKITKEQWKYMDNCDSSNIKGLIKAARGYTRPTLNKYSNHFQSLLNMLNEDVARPDLRLNLSYPECPVRTTFYLFLIDYFSIPELGAKTEDPYLVKDIYETLKEVDKQYNGGKIKVLSHKKWLIDNVKTMLREKIANSISFFFWNILGNHKYLLPDQGARDFAELRNNLVSLDYYSVLKMIPLEGSFGEFFPTDDKLYRNLAKSIRKAILESQLYKDLCNISSNAVEMFGLKVHPPRHS